MKLIAALLLMCSPVMAQTLPTTAPTTQNTPAPLLNALREFESGRMKEGLAVLDEFEKALPKPLPVKLQSADAINMFHCRGFAYLKLGQLDKAKPALERAYNGTKTNRSLIINHAVIDILQKTNAMRAVNDLKKYAILHPEDELAVNLWGMALDRAATGRKLIGIEQHAKDYLAVDAILQKTRPGFKRWGTEWISEKEFMPIERERKQNQEACAAAQRGVDEAIKRFDRAKADYKSKNVLGTAKNRNDQERRASELQSALEDMNEAQEAVTAAEEVLIQQQAKAPRPSWTMKLEPVTPDLNLVDE